MTVAGSRLRGFSLALQNRRFRWLLIAIAGSVAFGGYVVQTLVQPITDPAYTFPDWWVYLHAAWALAQHHDPYLYTATCRRLIQDPAFDRSYIYPPFLAWLLQPLGQPYPPGFPKIVPPACIEQPITLNHGLDIAEMLGLQAALWASLLLLIRVVRIRDRQLQVLIILLAVNWLPVRIDLDGQVNLVLLLLVVVWLWGWTRGRQIAAGVALGLIFAIKLLSAPLILLELWGRRGWAVLGSALAVVVCWGAADPQLLPSYVIHIAPRVAAGTGFRENQAPAGTLARILHPSSFYGQVGSLPRDVQALAVLVALVVLAATAAVLYRSRDASAARLLQAGLVISAMPLLVELQTPSQYVTLLIPLAILLARGVDCARPRLVWWVLGIWALTGPVHSSFLYAIAQGFKTDWTLRIWAETGIVGLVGLWLVCLRELDGAAKASRGAQTIPSSQRASSVMRSGVQGGS